MHDRQPVPPLRLELEDATEERRLAELFYEEDKAVAERLGVEYSGVPLHPLDLAETTRLWGAASAYVNVNSYGGPFDFTSILYLRDELEEVVQRAEPGLRDRLSMWLVGADAAYMAATEPDTGNLWSEVHELSATDGWWWRRVPSAGPLRDLLEKRVTIDPAT